MILDSCHSGGASRDFELLNSEVYRIREFLELPSIPLDCDSDIVRSETRGASQTAGFQGQDLDSHIAIAACSSNQSAAEDSSSVPIRGVFTRAFTAVLREKNISEMTYKSLISHISITIESQAKHIPA